MPTPPPLRFKRSRTDLLADQAPRLAAVVRTLHDHPRFTLIVDGHRSPRERQGLGWERAQQTRRLLVEAGVAAERITPRERSDLVPIPEANAQAHQRVTFQLMAPAASRKVEPASAFP